MEYIKGCIYDKHIAMYLPPQNHTKLFHILECIVCCQPTCHQFLPLIPN